MRKQMLLVLIMAIAALIGCGRPKDDRHIGPNPGDNSGDLEEEVPTPLRGFDLVSKLLKQRVFADENFDLKSYLDPEGKVDPSESLTIFIMGEEGRGQTTVKSTATPQALNTYVWYMFIHNLAADIARSCDNDERSLPALYPELDHAIQRLCREAKHGVTEATLNDLWNVMLKEDGNVRDQELWRKFHRGPDAPESSKDLVYEAILTALFNHDFLAGK
jgi:hypothetical protein